MPPTHNASLPQSVRQPTSNLIEKSKPQTMETARDPKTENKKDLTINPQTTSQLSPVVSLATPADTKMATSLAPTEITLPINSPINSKTSSGISASIGADNDATVATESNMNTNIAPVEAHPPSEQAPVRSAATSNPPIAFNTESNKIETRNADKNFNTAKESDMNSKLSFAIEIKQNSEQLAVNSNIPTESATESKSVSEINPAIGDRYIDTKPTNNVEETLAVEIKVNSNSGPAIVNKEAVKTVSNSINNPKISKPNTPTNPKMVTAAPHIPKTLSKLSPTANNKENIKPVPVGPKNIKKAIAVESRKGPNMNSARSNNGDSEMKSELQSKCRAKGLPTSGSPTHLVHRLVQSDRREKEFEQEHERQLKEFQRMKAEEKARSETTGAQSSSRVTSRASSVASDSHPSKSNAQNMPPATHINAAPRRQCSSGTKIRSPTIPNSTVPFARTFVSQDIRLQQKVTPMKTNDPAPTVSALASQDARVQSDSMPAQIDIVKNQGPFVSQDIKVHQMVAPANNETFKISRPFIPQDIRVLQGSKPAGTDTMVNAWPFVLQNTGSYNVVMPLSNRIVKPARQFAPQGIRVSQVAKHTNIKIVKTSREADKANYLHKHNWEIKEECEKKGLQKWGSRTAMVTRLLDHHLSNLRAEFKHARDEYARSPIADAESLLKKDILWYRLECFVEHRQNQIGLAGEPHRAASYTAAKECKYSSPRFAKIMADELAVLIAREKNLEEEKAKKELELAAAGKEINSEVKLEPCW
ncbi:hypothetical protein BKA61DRAFT_578008 [Leptodontidium sp. MPI-SDFR-AT-0119]|nr:hypothetical protein BKA61DRAFT_578008 [Leptodontidium sp. MPI-SDFR-AT-0119]